ncbi:hypothetical protein MBAV_005425 [Candidatus Magnetobacterium bavaricum]|uniref:Uncharacterized protein n=1 Tax=Candidatus Magnetobacterium bavaricum TaxID=29290 RepID=A0A0F3GNY6_9BACT|nr:hypothetical protein MBAV_005425 [Candidatus Magnetobacterium bavaricum]
MEKGERIDMSTMTLEAPIEAYTEQGLIIKEQADNINITSPESYEAAGQFVKGIKGLMTDIKDTFGPLKKKASESHKAVVKEEAERLTPLQEAEGIIKGKMAAYLKTEELNRRVMQAMLEAEAKKQHDERCLQEALALEAAGNVSDAIAVLDTPNQTPAPLVVSNIPKVTGVSEREVWKFEVVDASKVPDQYKTVDEKKIGAIVRALKGVTDIPGVRVWSEKQMAVRG